MATGHPGALTGPRARVTAAIAGALRARGALGAVALAAAALQTRCDYLQLLSSVRFELGLHACVTARAGYILLPWPA